MHNKGHIKENDDYLIYKQVLKKLILNSNL